ncbi:MAG TPA: protein-disulfide reductase DsbD domain-containing protein [Terriglobales bacterium]|nr:protein-disulfide reductase DsbD domain-containing protein [Terriglobales bacterium]
MNRIIPGMLLVLVACALTQEMPVLKAPVVSLAPVPIASIPQGKSGTVPLSFRIVRGYHINSNKPKSEFLIPTALKVDATTDIVIGRITYPDGKDMSFAFSPDEKLNVYAGDFEVGVMVRPLRSVQAGKYMIRGNLKYQACDNAQCYPPKQMPVSFEVRISKAAAPARKNPAQSPHAHK